jgi:thiol-disulfide isomerase/thioredoxin
MKKHLFYPILVALVFTPSAVTLAVDPPVASGAASPASSDQTAGAQSADVAYAKVDASQKQPAVKFATREEAQAWLANQQTLGKAFVKDFPNDPRNASARLITLRAGLQERRLTGKAETPDAERAKFDELINAKDVPLPIKAEAAFLRALTYASELQARPGSYNDFHAAAADFAAKYAAHPLSTQMKEMDFRVLSEDPTSQADELLKKYSTGEDERMAVAAKALILKRAKMVELKSKPLELNFIASNGKEIDLTSLRGKVVLIHFWATWSPPSLAELPNLVETYKKFRPKGLEVLGICLDQEKAKMVETTKKLGMEWDEHFDGGGWKNKVSSGLGIDSIPATWLVDKKGNLRLTGLRGPALDAAIEKLLAE